MAIILFGFVLSHIPGQNTPYIDSFTNITILVGTILMALRYKEQFYFFILLNMASTIMWIFSSVSSNPEANTMIVLFIACFISTVYGLINWNRKLIKENEAIPA